MPTPTPDTPPEATAIPPGVVACTLRLLLAALPAVPTPDMAAENADTARAMFFALQPQTAAEAAAAARSVAAHFASMDMYARAARPGLSDDTARSLRASANACSRTADAAQRHIRKPARPARPPPAPEPQQAEPKPPRRQPEPPPFQPRDRFGQPIPPIDLERMSMAQRRARYCWPRNPELEAIAIAEEEAAIAEQQALEAKEREAAAAG